MWPTPRGDARSADRSVRWPARCRARRATSSTSCGCEPERTGCVDDGVRWSIDRGGRGGAPVTSRRPTRPRVPGCRAHRRAEIARHRAHAVREDLRRGRYRIAGPRRRGRARIDRCTPRPRPARARAAVVDAGPTAASAARSSSSSAATARSCGPPNSHGPASVPVLGSTSAGSVSSPKPRPSDLDEALATVVDRDYRVEDRMTLDVDRPGRRRGHRRGLGAERGEHRERVPAEGARGDRSRSTAAPSRRSAATACSSPRRPVRPPTRSPRADRWCGRTWRRCW